MDPADNINPDQNQAQPVGRLQLDAGLDSEREKSLQTIMPEPRYGHAPIVIPRSRVATVRSSTPVQRGDRQVAHPDNHELIDSPIMKYYNYKS